MAKNQVLITGGSGLIGSRLSELLSEKGYNVSWLSRKSGRRGDIQIYKWDYKNREIEEEAIRKADYVVHLAGANVGERRWNKSFKKEIFESRVSSTDLLFESISKINPHIRAFIAGSAVGIYGSDRGQQWVKEESEKGNDFLADVVVQWEKSALKFKDSDIRTAIIRTGIVLSDKGGVLEKMAQPIKLYAGASLASGDQYVPWIHIDDLCNIFIKAIEDKEITGVYNAVAPNPVTNERLTKEIARVLDKPVILPNVPAWTLKVILGEFADSVIGSLRVSSEKIEDAGFRFKFREIEKALKDLTKEKT